MKIDRLFVVSLGAITGIGFLLVRTGGRGAKTEYPDPACG